MHVNQVGLHLDPSNDSSLASTSPVRPALGFLNRAGRDESGPGW